MNTKTFVYLGLFALLTTLTACGNGSATTNDSADEEEVTAIPVEVVAVRTGSVTAAYSTTATLEADREARIVPKLGGTLIELLVEEGDAVVAGQVLARLDDEQYKLELAVAQANLNRLQQDFNRNREMFSRNLISAETFERLKFEFEAQQAQFDLAKLVLSHTAITAPIGGVISERMVKVGNTVNTQEAVFVVTSMDPLLASLHIPEREIARLAVGQPATLHADALRGQNFAGRVARISPVVDASTGTFRVTVEIDGRSGQLKPGMFGRINIIHDTRDNALMVPVDAVMIEDSRVSVFVIEDSKAKRRLVRTGYRNNGEYEILEGLSEGEQVVVTGHASLRNDTLVVVVAVPGDATAQAE